MRSKLIKTPFPFRPPIERKEGTHVSDVINKMLELVYNNKSREFTEQDRIRMEMGFIWECMCEVGWRDLLGWRPEELQVDGIWMSPDYLGIEDEGIVVREMKCTWKSVHPTSGHFDPTDQLRWMMQAKSYCHAVGATVALFYVYHVNGNYRPPAPVFEGVWRIEFTDLELVENWQSIVNFAKTMKMI